VPPELVPTTIDGYSFDEPLLLVDGGLSRFADVSLWCDPALWARSLSALPSRPKAVILPLELEAPGWKRQDLLGYELLNSLRWAGQDLVRGCPIIVAAWQRLDQILRKKPDLLLVRPSIEFVVLPEAVKRLADLLNDIQTGRFQPATKEEIEEAAGDVHQHSERVSYHDLANDFYAAHRLWAGYRSLLDACLQSDSMNVAREHHFAASLKFDWEPYVEAKLESPLIRRYLATRRELRAPRYPTVENGGDILAYHLDEGLPEGTRVLFVDDEFHKGFAQVLLRILFRADSFTRQMADEWVYSESAPEKPESRWARFVCVRNAELARHWLRYWDQLGSDDVHNHRSWDDWLRRWVAELSPRSNRHSAEAPEAADVFGDNREFVLDRHSVGPRIKSTVVLLDLRLEPVKTALYSIKDFPSYGLRQSIKSEKPDMPVIMFTASRQVLNFAELLDSSSDIDGWFIKEAPDIPVDPNNENSANSVAYLLERVHLYSTLRGWYRPSFSWNAERKLAYAKLFHSKEAPCVFEEISRLAGSVFAELVERQRSHSSTQTETFLSFIQDLVPSNPFPIAQTLVARRVAIATLLWTADMSAAGPEWNVDAFAAMLPGRQSKKHLKWVYDKINFNQVLWMRSSGILSQLLKEEVEWLERIKWPEGKVELIQAALVRERQFLTL
jgi:hypothetical protein